VDAHPTLLFNKIKWYIQIYKWSVEDPGTSLSVVWLLCLHARLSSCNMAFCSISRGSWALLSGRIRCHLLRYSPPSHYQHHAYKIPITYLQRLCLEGELAVTWVSYSAIAEGTISSTTELHKDLSSRRGRDSKTVRGAERMPHASCLTMHIIPPPPTPTWL
jgi:hypothetical protein